MQPGSELPLTIAILGAGNMGNRLAKSFLRIPGVRVKSVYSRRLAVAEKLATAVGAKPCDQMEPIFADPEVEAVVLCLPTHSRTETLRAAVQTGKHIFCEKPLALNPGMAKEVKSLLAGYSRCVMVGQVLRFFWEYRQMHDRVIAGEAGRIGTVRLSRCVGYPGTESWFADPAFSGGIVLDLLVHDIDFLLWTFGEVAQVYARSLTDNREVPLDYALLNLRLRSGALAHIEGSWAHPVGSFRQTVEIAGSEGLLSFDSGNGQELEWLSTVDQSTGLESRISLPETGAGTDPYTAEAASFIDSIRQNISPPVLWQEALRACQVAFGAIESARRGIPIQFPEKDDS
jgi:UDP-N-acetylglucosamine 3-dehydrogenase